MPDTRLLPNHIGLIMDGNGRWAKKRGLPRKAGHKAGVQTFRKIVRYCNKIGLKYLTVYALSTENWKRPKEEIDSLMQLFREFLSDAENYKKENVKTIFIGDRSILDQDIQDRIKECELESSTHTGLTLNMAINYGGRDEILRAARHLAADLLDNTISYDQIDENSIEARLDTAGQPDVDLIIRPSGEQRLSNFLLWQAAYAEFIFMDVLWPDFNEAAMNMALEEFAKRNRRFGGI